MGKPSQTTFFKKKLIKKKKNELLFLEKLITRKPLPTGTVLFALRMEFMRVVDAILTHIESKGKKTDSQWVQQLLLAYALQHGSIRRKEKLEMTSKTQLVAMGDLDMAVMHGGKAYSLDLDQVGELLAWLTKNPKQVKRVKSWV